MRSSIAAALLFAGAGILAACDTEPTTPSQILGHEARTELSHPALEAANSWSTKAPMLTPRAFLVAVGHSNGLTYAIGGSDQLGNALSTVEAYDASANSWSTKAALPEPRSGASGAAVIFDKIYVPGGISSGGPKASLFIYNTGTNSWTSGANLPVLSAFGEAAAIGGKLYVVTPGNVIGRVRSGTVSTPFLHRYDPATNNWVELARPPRHHAFGVMRAINGKLYLVGGIDGDGDQKVVSAKLDVYNPATNSWAPGAAMPTPRYGATGQVTGGRLVVVGGSGSANAALSKVEAYDPATNTWTTRAPLPGARSLLASGGKSGTIFAIGGQNASGTTVSTNQAYTP